MENADGLALDGRLRRVAATHVKKRYPQMKRIKRGF
jgi:hypothetical protein